MSKFEMEKMEHSLNLEWINLNLEIKESEFSFWKCKRQIEEKTILNDGMNFEYNLERDKHFHPIYCCAVVYIISVSVPIKLVGV